MNIIPSISLHNVHNVSARPFTRDGHSWIRLTFNEGFSQQFELTVFCKDDMLIVADAINEAMVDVRSDRADARAYRAERGNPDAVAHEVA